MQASSSSACVQDPAY